MTRRELEDFCDELVDEELIPVVAVDVEWPDDTVPPPPPPEIPDEPIPVAELAEYHIDRLYMVTTESDQIELWEHPDHDVTLAFGYTDAAMLVAECGIGQPFQRRTVAELGRRLDPETRIAVNDPFPGGHRYPEPAVDDFPDEVDVDVAPAEPDPLLYMPTTPKESETGAFAVELLPGRRGERILCVWTSVAALQAGAGPFQPWRPIRLSQLDWLANEVRADSIKIDPDIPDQARHTGLVTDWRENLFEEDDDD